MNEMNQLTPLDVSLNNITCFQTKPIQSLLELVEAKKLLKQGESCNTRQNPEEYLSLLEINFLTSCDAQENTPERRVLHILNDLKSCILSYQDKNISAYDCHHKLHQTYALITELIKQCKPSTRDNLLAAKIDNEVELERNGYTYSKLLQACNRVISILHIA